MKAQPPSLFPDSLHHDDRRNHRLLWARISISKKLQVAVDFTVLAMAFALAYILRFDFEPPPNELYNGLIQLPFVIFIQFLALILAGVYAFIWRYIGMAEIGAFFKAALWSFLPITLFRFGMPKELEEFRVPLSIILMDMVLAFGAVFGLRVLRRRLYERYEKREGAAYSGAEDSKRVLLIGAGRAGVLAAKEIIGRGGMGFDVRGFIDDDPNKRGAVIQGIKVIGSTEELPQLAKELGVHLVVISMAQVSRREVRRIMDICEQAQLKVQIIPGLYEIIQGNISLSRIRNIQIEDLLGRETVSLDDEEMRRFLTNKRVMVTGAGGSIGSELARQVARLNPAVLLLAERAEFALFAIGHELCDAFPDLKIVSLVADVCDDDRMRKIFASFQPQVILHAAAHKHVPMMEQCPTEAIKNNALGTHSLGEMAGKYGVEVFVLISTDKAVRPRSIMGASKRVAELAVQELNERYATRFVSVRFGNVIGSAGSVIPIFQKQISKGGPLTVTHPRMVRYFMTIPEAAQLVLQAGTIGNGGEIFILDMGEPMNILELAKDIIILSGFKPFEDIDIVFTGIRPGEKLFEELETREEKMTKTPYPKIFIGKIAPCPARKVREALKELARISKNGNEQELCQVLSQLIPEALLDMQETTEAREIARFVSIPERPMAIAVAKE